MSKFDKVGIVSLLGHAGDASRRAVDAIQSHGLRALLAGEPATVRQIAELSGLSLDEVTAGVDGLLAAGRLEIDGESVVGVGGLTISETIHSLEVRNAAIHTWCALDAIGVPAALGIDAKMSTTCPHCGERLHVYLDAGKHRHDPEVRLFCPTGPCTDVRADFCTSANLFCSLDHLLQWKTSHPAIQGDVLDLDETAELGLVMWSRI